MFFFQAEDGIRDLTVTGVQTCALPILWRPTCIHAGEYTPRRGPHSQRSWEQFFRWALTSLDTSSGCLRIGRARRRKDFRSEERRVGKEGRYRRWPDH